MKRVWSILLSICMLASVLPLGVPAQTSEFSYAVYNGNATITKYNGAGGDVELPSVIEGYPVVAIGEKAFAGCTALTSVVIPEGVTAIGFRAFYGCSNLLEVDTPETLTVIERNAFQDCYRLLDFYFPDALTSIGEFAFGFCVSLTRVVIPSGVEQMGRGVFDNCQSLAEIYCYFTEIPGTWHAKWNEYCDATVYIIDDGEDPVNVLQYTVEDGEATVVGIQDAVGELVIPAEYEGCPVTAIGSYAFLHCKGLTGVVIPEGVTSIGEGAFGGCSSLKSITLPSSLKTIGASAFSRCAMTSLVLPEGVESIGEWAFTECYALKNILIPGSAASMGGYVFFGCKSLKNIYCSAESQPEGWSEDWEHDVYLPVHWGVDELPSGYGDVNEDGKINSADVTRLLRYLANRNPQTGVSSVTVGIGADCNGDGKINSADVTRLLRYLANRNPQTGESDIELGA